MVTRELADGTTQRHEPDEYERFLDDCEGKYDLDAFEAAVDDLVARTTRYDAGIDRFAAPAIHAALPLPRREAAHPGVWRFLAVIHRPEFVRHRWEMRSWSTMRTRFWRPGTRPDSNAIGRLWWIAELSREGDSYELTARALARQPIATSIFVRQFSSYRPAVEAFVTVMEDAVSDEIEAVVRRFNALLSTIVLEGQTVEELVEWLGRIRGELDR